MTSENINAAETAYKRINSSDIIEISPHVEAKTIYLIAENVRRVGWENVGLIDALIIYAHG
jgi:hypothetical protein